jgi:hypothetical protein
MKSYTDLKQSKKLAEILPIESADMKFPYFGDGQYGETACFGEPIEFSGEKDIPCWSLAALIGALPLGVDIHNITDGHKIYYYVEIYTKEIYMKLKRMSKEEICLSSKRHENLVDACVEMIFTLKQRKIERRQK